MRSSDSGQARKRLKYHEKGLQNLSYAIVHQAVLDYKGELNYLYRNRNWRTERAIRALYTIAEVRDFFRGEWFELLGGECGDEIIKRLEKGYSENFLKLL